MAAMGNSLTQRRREAEVAEKVRSVPLWSVTTWDKKFNTVAKDKQKKVIRYHYFLASELEPIVELGGTVKILTTYESDLWTAESKVQGCVSEGEVVSIPWGGNPNVQYFKGRFVTADNRIATSSDTSILSNRYLFYFMLAKKDLIGSFYRGASLKHPEMSKVLDMMIPLPPLPEQKRIAATLDKICELKKNAETRLAKLDLTVKSRFVEMFGEGKYPEVTIESLAAHEKNAFKAGPFGSSLKKEFYVESGYKIYGQEQVISGDANYGNYYIDEAKYKTLESCKIQEGDVLVSLVGTYGKTLVIPHSFRPGIINPRLIKLTFDKERISPIYFQQFFSLDSTRDMLDRNCHGCTMGVLNLGIIKALKIPLPPLALQREFAAFVEKVEKLKEIAKRSAEQMDVLYRSKLQEYFG